MNVPRALLLGSAYSSSTVRGKIFTRVACSKVLPYPIVVNKFNLMQTTIAALPLLQYHTVSELGVLANYNE